MAVFIPNEIKPNFSWMKHINMPIPVPIQTPKDAIIRPSNKKIFFIEFSFIPKDIKTDKSLFLSIANMLNKKKILKEDIINIKLKIKNTINFSVFKILYKSACCSSIVKTEKLSPTTL